MKRFIFLVVCGLMGNAHTFEQPELQPVQFWSQLYPLSPLRNVHALSMRLWGIVDQASRKQAAHDIFLNNHAAFAQELMHLHSIVIVLLASLETQENHEIVSQAVQDCQHIYNVVASIGESYESVVEEYQDEYVSVVRYILSALSNRLEHTLSTGSVVLPLYAAASDSSACGSKQTTLLFAPAKIVPVAPIA